jgi:acetolactate synthase I/II/III large subunit
MPSHIQELETVRRHGIKLLICIINDGGYGAETHKFRAYGVDPMHATHGRGDLAQIARGFGLSGTKVTRPRGYSANTRHRMAPLCGTCMSTT